MDQAVMKIVVEKIDENSYWWKIPIPKNILFGLQPKSGP